MYVENQIKDTHERKVFLQQFTDSQAYRADALVFKCSRHEAERRQLTVTCCDLVGSTALSRQLEAHLIVAVHHGILKPRVRAVGSRRGRYVVDTADSVGLRVDGLRFISIARWRAVRRIIIARWPR